MKPDPQSTEGFRALAVRLQPSPAPAVHVFFRPFSGHNDLPQDRTLFVAGLPFLHGHHEAVLKQLFCAFGAVDTVVVSALILFSQPEGRNAAMEGAAAGKVLTLPLEEPQEPHGLKGWVEAHKAQFPGNSVLKERLDNWMEAFEAREEEERRRQMEGANDGWTLVTKKSGRRKTSDESGIAVGSVPRAVAEGRAVKQVLQLENFYKHQRKDKQRNALLDLRQRFEEDKKKVAELRAARRFKPY